MSRGLQRMSRFKSKSECLRIRLGTFNVGIICGKKTEVCEKLRKRRADVYCMKEIT